MPAQQLPHYWTQGQVRQLLDAMLPGQPWLLTLLLWRMALRQAEVLGLQWRDLQFSGPTPTVTVRQGKGGRYRVVPAHPELVDAFRSVRKGRPDEPVFVGRGGTAVTPRTVNRWICQSIAKAGLSGVATGTGKKGQGATACAIPAPATGCNRA